MYFEGPIFSSHFKYYLCIVRTQFLLFQSHIKFHLEEKHVIASRARYKQLSHFQELLGLLTQLQQDTKGNIMDIFLLLPSCGWCVNHSSS